MCGVNDVQLTNESAYQLQIIINLLP